MGRAFFLAVMLAVLASCKEEAPPVAPAPVVTKQTPKGRLDDLLRGNSQFVGFLYSADQPSIIAWFNKGMLMWRSDPQNQSFVQGRADVFTWPDKSCIGFEQKNLFMPTHGPERYLVCEAVEPIKHRNNLPRSQDFSFQRGDVFLEYQPPQGTGYSQIYFLGEPK
jgi:hypothetical protein